MAELAIILPTYNEAENLALLVEQLEGLGLDLHILVVDDNRINQEVMIGLLGEVQCNVTRMILTLAAGTRISGTVVDDQGEPIRKFRATASPSSDAMFSVSSIKPVQASTAGSTAGYNIYRDSRLT